MSCVRGVNSPVNPGCGQLDCIFTWVDFAKGGKDNDSAPDKVISALTLKSPSAFNQSATLTESQVLSEVGGYMLRPG